MKSRLVFQHLESVKLDVLILTLLTIVELRDITPCALIYCTFTDVPKDYIAFETSVTINHSIRLDLPENMNL